MSSPNIPGTIAAAIESTREVLRPGRYVPWSAVLKLLSVAAPVVEFLKEAIAIATKGASKPRATYTPKGTMPSHLSPRRSDVETRLGPAPEVSASGATAWTVLPAISHRLAWASSG